MRTQTASAAFITTILLFLSVPVWGQSLHAKDPRPVVTLSTGVLDKYIVRIGKVAYPKPVLQVETAVSFSNGLSVNLWGSTGLDGKETPGREIDASVGYADRTIGFGAALYNLIPLHRISGDVLDLFAEGRHQFGVGNHAVTPYARVNGMIATTDAGRNSGFIGALGIRHAWQLHPRLNVSHSFELLYNTPIYGGSSGLIGRYDAALTTQLSKSVTLSLPVLRVAVPVTHSTDRGLDAAIGGKIALSFR